MTDVQDLAAYLAGHGVTVYRASGQEVTAHCLWCADGDPKGKGKLYLNVESWLYDCKRCGERGNRKTLLEHFGDEDSLEHVVGQDPGMRRRILAEAAALAHEMLLGNDAMLEYLLGRGFTPETIIRKQYGYVPMNTGLSKMLPAWQSKVAKPADLLSAGLITAGGQEFFNRSIVIPYFSHGSVIQLREKKVDGKYRTAGGDSARLYNADSLHGADSVVVVEGEFDCFTGDTELLTPAGWQRLDAYVGGPVTQVHPDGRLEMVSPLAVGVRKDVEVLRFSTERTGGVDLVVTPGHRLVATDADFAPFTLHRADQRPSARAHMPRAGVMDAGGIERSDDEIALLLAIAADASIDHRKSDGAQYVRFGFTKQRKVARLQAILERLGVQASTSLLASGATSICFRVPNYLTAFKLMPFSWVAQAKARQREFILAEMVEWDGNRVASRNQVEFSTGYKWNADWMQAMAHTAGRVATIMERTNKHGSWFKVSILHSKRSTSWQSIRASDAGRATVHAVQVPTGMLLVRRRDMVVVSGNCDMLEQTIQDSGDRDLMQTAVVGLPGAGSWPEGFVESLSSVRRVFIGMDPDDTGKRFAEKLKDELGNKARVLDLPDALPKCDWNDYLKDHDQQKNPHGGHTWRDVHQMLIEADLAGKRMFSVADAAAKWTRQRNEKPGIRLGWTQLDAILRPGLKPGQLVIPLAKTGTGKTVWLSNVAHNIRDRRVLYVSLEMTAAEVFEHFRRIHHFWFPQATADERNAAYANIRIVDQNRLGKGDMRDLIREFADEVGAPPEVVLVDYLQYYARGFRGSGQYEKTSDAVMELKAVAKEESLVVICPSQVSRNGEDGKPLSLDDARDSGVVEETGDFVAALFRPDQVVSKDDQNTSMVQTGTFNLQLLKSRHGGKGRVFNFRLSNLSLVIVDVIDRKASQRVEQENSLARSGVHYEDFRKDVIAAVAQSHLPLDEQLVLPPTV